ncbi:MAG: cytochrome d ubiquinol oxidase subunit II [bacterium]
MMSVIASLGLPELIAGIMMLSLNAYALMGGADFGGGVWDLLARGPRRDAQRALVSASIAPIWEANHVWLIIVVVMLFTAFPDAFATLGIVLHIPLSLMLIGIVLRGAAFVFRSYGSRGSAAQSRWGLVFATASVVTPLLLGIIVGAIATGSVGDAAAQIPRHRGALDAAMPNFADVFITPWLEPFPLAIGAMALALFAYLAAVYLAYAARDAELREDFRRNALIAAGAVFVTALTGLVVAETTVPQISHRLMTSAWALPFQSATAIAAIAAIWALVTRRWSIARVAAAAQVTLILWGWAFVQYPLLIPPSLTIRGAAAPRLTLELLLWALAIGGVLLLPSLVYLFRTFSAERHASDTRS